MALMGESAISDEDGSPAPGLCSPGAREAARRPAPGTRAVLPLRPGSLPLLLQSLPVSSLRRSGGPCAAAPTAASLPPGLGLCVFLVSLGDYNRCPGAGLKQRAGL